MAKKVARKKRSPLDWKGHEDFKVRLEETAQAARNFIYENHRLWKPDDSNPDFTQIDLFGGIWRLIIDKVNKRVYAVGYIQKPNHHDVAAPLGWDEKPKTGTLFHFPLLVTGQVAMDFKTKMHKIVKEFIEDKLEAYGDFCYVKSENMMMVPMDVPLPDGKMVRREVFEYRATLVHKMVVTVLNTCWGVNCPWAKAVRIIGKKLWEVLDRDMCRHAVAIKGRQATSYHYSLVWNNAEEVAKVAKHSAGLLPIWPETMKGRWKSGAPVFPNIVSDTKEFLETKFGAHKITPRAWRYLLKMKPLWVQQLTGHYKAEEVITDQRLPLWRQMAYRGVQYDPATICTLPAILDVMAEAQETPKFTPMLHVTRYIAGARRTPAVVAFVRAAFRASRRKPAKTFWQHEASLVWDWVSRENLLFDHNQMNADWSWFMRQQHQWHIDEIKRKRTDLANRTWDSVLGETEIEGYKVIPLTTGIALEEEGVYMHHCVGGYMSQCENNTSRIFSIRKGEDRVATVEIRIEVAVPIEGGILDAETKAVPQEDVSKGNKTPKVSCYVAQNRGPCNHDVSEEVEQVGHIIANQYADAANALSDEDRQKRVFHSPTKKVTPLEFDAEEAVIPPPDHLAPEELEHLRQVFGRHPLDDHPDVIAIDE